jgi:type II secretory pathway pseudopilin PulG
MVDEQRNIEQKRRHQMHEFQKHEQKSKRLKSRIFWSFFIVFAAAMAVSMVGGAVWYVSMNQANATEMKIEAAQQGVAELHRKMAQFQEENPEEEIGPGFDLGRLVEGKSPVLLRSDQLTDPWGNKYLLLFASKDTAKYEVLSLGADGRLGGVGVNQDVIHVSE